MVNEKHYARLNKGVQVWNEWILENLGIIPDLSKANLIGTNLIGTNLIGANLSEANLSEANLSRANLSRANLSRANLSEACLMGANLMGANLSEACLMGTNLSGVDFSKLDFSKLDFSDANLSGANLSGANLIGANFSKANLSGANLSRANFSKANLSRANLSGAFLMNANLDNANLSRANLSAAFLNDVDISGANLNDIDVEEADKYGLEISRINLSGANLSNVFLVNANIKYAKLSGLDFSSADLTGADLNYSDFSRTNLTRANLSRTQALKTDFTNAKFTGACLEDWNINSATKLNDIDCQYIYLKSNEQERRPSSGEFAPGEFSKLFQKALETVDLIFSNGIDWEAFLLSFQELQAEYGEENLSVQAIEKKSGGAFVIRLEVPPEANKADIEFREKEIYQRHISLIEAQLKDKENLLNDYRKIVDDNRKDNTDLKDLIKTLADNRQTININMEAKAESNPMSEFYRSKYDQRNSKNQFVDTAQSGSNPTFNQYNYTPQQRQNLAEAAVEIQQLLQQLEQTNPTTSTSEKMTVVVKAIDEIEKNPTLKARIIGALKSGGTEALKEAIDHPLVNILMASIEGWQEAE